MMILLIMTARQCRNSEQTLRSGETMPAVAAMLQINFLAAFRARIFPRSSRGGSPPGDPTNGGALTFLGPTVDAYLERYRPVLARTGHLATALWLSANDGTSMSYDGVEHTISKTTQSTIGVNVSPHLFRTSAASTSAIYAGATNTRPTQNLVSKIFTHHASSTLDGHHRTFDIVVALDRTRLGKRQYV